MTPEAWRAAMRDWALPEAILARAPESPWGFPVELFRSRMERAATGTLTFSNRRARDALPPDGTVLDIGVGAGAASLPLHPRCSLIVGVNSSADSLAEFQRQAAHIGAPVRTMQGDWPALANRAPAVDVVVCNHVAYNVADLEPFVIAMTSHARRRVVMELTARHPTAWMADLWLRFHGLDRPLRPDANDAASLLRGLGLPVRRHRGVEARAHGGFERREDAVGWIRRRLCLDSSHDAEVAEALGDRLRYEDGFWSVSGGDEPVVTLWWDAPAIAG